MARGGAWHGSGRPSPRMRHALALALARTSLPAAVAWMNLLRAGTNGSPACAAIRDGCLRHRSTRRQPAPSQQPRIGNLVAEMQAVTFMTCAATDVFPFGAMDSLNGSLSRSLKVCCAWQRSWWQRARPRTAPPRPPACLPAPAHPRSVAVATWTGSRRCRTSSARSWGARGMPPTPPRRRWPRSIQPRSCLGNTHKQLPATFAASLRAPRALACAGRPFPAGCPAALASCVPACA